MRQQVNSNAFNVQYVRTADQLADIMTKALATV